MEAAPFPSRQDSLARPKATKCLAANDAGSGHCTRGDHPHDPPSKNLKNLSLSLLLAPSNILTAIGNERYWGKERTTGVGFVAKASRPPVFRASRPRFL